MPPKQKSLELPRSPALRLKSISVAVMAALVFSGASAAGLGKITVLSGLGQPLNAEIELTATSPEEARSLTVKLASAEAFRQANIELTPALNGLRFVIEQRGSAQVVRISSVQPLNEPFLNLLLEVAGANSKLVREYTFLLDPPELRRPQTAQAGPAAIAPAPAASATALADDRRNRAASQAAQSARQALQPAGRAADGTSVASRSSVNRSNGTNDGKPGVAVKQGDTLGRIARDIKPEGVSLDQMLVGLYRANPDAFAGANMNRLRAGQILAVPDEDAARATAPAEARQIVIAQAADFNSYRSKLAGQVAESATQGRDPAQLATGKIGARVEEQQTPANAAKDKLTLSKSGLPTGAAGAAGAAAASPAEDKIASDKAAADAQARVRELEKNVGDLQKLLSLKNRDMAERQQQAAGKDPSAAADLLAANKPDASKADAVQAAAGGNPGSAVAGNTAAVSPVAGSNLPSVPEGGTGNATASVVPPKPELKPIAIPQKPVPTAPDVIEHLLENPALLAAAGLGLGALAAMGIYVVRRRRNTQAQSWQGAPDDDGGQAHATSAANGAAGLVRNSVFHSSFTPSHSQLDASEVDPIAEADVYIAYGRDVQAEEILREALRTRPERHAVRLKLLEIYAARKDLSAFNAMADELRAMTGGRGDAWEQAVALGMILDPGSPVFAGAAAQVISTAGSANDAAVPAAGNVAQHKTMPAELDGAMVPELSVSLGTTAVGAMAASTRLRADLSPQVAPLSTATDNGLDFDFNLGSGDAPKEITPSSASSASSVQKAPLDSAADASPKDLSGPFDFDFDLLKPVEGQFDGLASANLKDGRTDDLQGSEDTADAEDTTPTRKDRSIELAPLDLDLSAIDLNLDPAAAASAVVQASVPVNAAASTSTGVKAAAPRANAAEMATKLDLAQAYQEIGDADGARELLDEVIAGGSAEQVAAAQSMRTKLA